MAIRNWLFDLDGTLVDSCGDLSAAVNQMRRHFRLPPLDEAQVSPMLGDGMRRLTERALGDGPAVAADVAAVDEGLKILRTYYGQHFADRSHPYPGVVATLTELRRRGGRIAVVSNKMADAARGVLEALDLATFCDMILGDGEGLKLKPAPDLVLEAMRRWQAQPSETAIVGDNYTDMAAGNAAGVTRVFATYGYGTLNGEKFDLAIGHFAELENL